MDCRMDVVLVGMKIAIILWYLSIPALGWPHASSMDNNNILTGVFFWTVVSNSGLKIFNKPCRKHMCCHPGFVVAFIAMQVLDGIFFWSTLIIGGFPNSSVGKEAACNAGDPGSIPGSGRSTGEGIGYPLHYSWASLVAQLIKNPPAMQETWVRSLGWDDPLGEGKGYPIQYSGLENSMDCKVHGIAKSRTPLNHFHLAWPPSWIILVRSSA